MLVDRKNIYGLWVTSNTDVKESARLGFMQLQSGCRAQGFLNEDCDATARFQTQYLGRGIYWSHIHSFAPNGIL